MSDHDPYSDRQLAFQATLAWTPEMQRASDSPHSKYRHVYPTVRIDTPLDPSTRPMPNANYGGKSPDVARRC